MHLFLSAGEISGDRYGAELARHIRNVVPTARISGFGGNNMAAAGVALAADMRDVSVMGFTDIPAKLLQLIRIKKELLRFIRNNRPDAILFIDFPDFHLSLARSIRRRMPDIPMYYLIPPQVWLWRAKRVILLRSLFRAVFPIFKFEHEFLLSRGVHSRFFGHPIADFIKYPQKPFEMQPTPGIGLLPGSRLAEISKILPIMLQTSRIVSRLIGCDVNLRIGIADELLLPSLHKIVLQHGYSPDTVPVERNLYDLAARSDVVIAKSGTNNLELAAHAVPFVVVYATSWINYLIGRYVVKPRHISLVNILSDNAVVPEFIQHKAKPDAIAAEVVALLNNTARRRQMTEALADVWARVRPESQEQPVLREIARSIMQDFG